jgi:MarR family transcriptional regulator, transcriptional regulator for hemolysin
MSNDQKRPEENIRRDISLKLTIMTRQLRLHFDKAVALTGLTRSQWALIVVVARNPGTSQRIIAQALEMSEASAGRLIDRLVSDGLLERRPHTEDRRAWCIFLTDRAKPLLDKIAAIATEVEKEAFDGMDDAQLKQFQSQLELICNNMGLSRVT